MYIFLDYYHLMTWKLCCLHLLLVNFFRYCNRRIIKFNKEGRVVEVWQTLVANTPLSIPHKIILNAAETSLFVADRENHRVLSFATSSRGHGQVFCREEELKGKPPYAISFNDSESDWPMYGVFGKTDHDNVMGFTIDKSGKKISIWGPDEVCTITNDTSLLWTTY